MRRMIAVLLVVALAGVVVTAIAVPAADAGGSSTATNIALGLASFAVFNQLVAAFSGPPAYAYGYPAYPAYPAPAYYGAPVVYSAPAPAVVVQQPAPQYSRVVQYPHGQYVLRGDGVYTAYQWVWIPNPPPPPPPPAPPVR
ncbi:MAG TPA: hypothetical protein VEH31_20595 [Streptosporangiaceae bacterium]|nr:hypothetical protein [Streptosporangiaceae bacterium]